ncbi:MAG: pyruvate dehydrogenase, partial [bacterium]|nr:pyruvate dehydrogenase [bacterium]
MATSVLSQDTALSERDERLLEIQNRVLWLAMQMIHHANHVRPSPDGSKVGGHQASSASVVTILTALFFDFMHAGDRISVKPHASPVYHAIQYLLGNLDGKLLTQLRAFHGLQAYPSRTKDPDGVDFSTGSVGLGAVAPNFAAVVDRYNQTHFGRSGERQRRYISLVGDAELDEGSVWEAIAEPEISQTNQVLWVVDLNRQSLDRIIPGIRVRVWREMFAANGWTVIDAKYGKRLQAAFEEPNGDLLRGTIDEMSNEVYQRLLRLSAEQLREWLPRTSRHPRDLARFIGRWDDQALQDLFRNLGGHDFPTLREAFVRVEEGAAPGVVFAYTLKGWMLPSVGDPLNHSLTLSPEQMEQLRKELGIPEDGVWDRFEPESPAGRLCRETRSRLAVPAVEGSGPVDPIPRGFGRQYVGSMSTQQIFGMVLTALSRHGGDFVDRVVTVSPDVASSTNLGGWINKTGVWAEAELESLPDEGVVRPLKWEASARGQHIELGISENNLFMMLGQLGASYEMHGEMLLPIGTLYDPFVRRGLDAFVYSVYSGAKFMVVGTPSGITLAPEGGAHQSVMTPLIGMGQPGLMTFEPAYVDELAAIMVW